MGKTHVSREKLAGSGNTGWIKCRELLGVRAAVRDKSGKIG